ncbi:hypothetical protein LUZ60_012674 [Juncus effusus]|nr:hypothetical protein LUZ60_012674 [Juncus effusus]
MGEEEELSTGSAMLAARLLEQATDSTEPEVDPRLLRAIKSAVRSSDAETRSAVKVLMTLMKRPHSQVRYLALLIIDELFMRSKLFRTLFVETLDQFLTLSVGFRKNSPLPPPSQIASNLHKKSIEFLEKWNSKFGIHYRQLRLGFDYLKNTLKLRFPNNPQNAARVQRERREREIRTQEILLSKYETLKENFESIKGEINSTVDEIKECLEILSRKNDEFEFNPFTNGEDEEMERIESLEMRKIRIDSMKESETVRETLENKALFDTLRELHKLLVTKHLISIQDWISVLIRVELSDNRFRDTALKELIDLRNNIHSIKNKLVQFGVDFDKGKRRIEDLEEEDFWEEGQIEKFPPNSTETKSKAEKTSKIPKKSNSNNNDTQNPNLDPERSKLLSEAPVINWGPFLSNWDSESKADILPNQKGLEIEAHWGRVDHDRIIPREKIAEIKLHRTIYEEEPIEIKSCLAPLRNGSLCQRRDLRICPFHGLIVPRDEKGNLVNSCKDEGEERESTSDGVERESASDGVERESNNCKDEGLSENNGGVERETMEELGREAVRNVRRRERDEREMKREKAKRVRKHNEEVLRESALASTSYSEDLVRSERGFGVKKQTLASMLKKKTTAKDRIAKKLL